MFIECQWLILLAKIKSMCVQRSKLAYLRGHNVTEKVLGRVVQACDKVGVDEFVCSVGYVHCVEICTAVGAVVVQLVVWGCYRTQNKIQCQPQLYV